MLRTAVRKILDWVYNHGDDLSVFNAGALPVSPVDGISLDKLNRILAAASRGHADELFALYSDIVSRDTTFIAGALQRKAPLVARPATFSAPPKADAETIRRRDLLRAEWSQCRGRRVAIAHLLDASAWPVSYVRKIYRQGAAGLWFRLHALEPVPWWHLTFAADANGPAGVAKVKLFDAAGNWTGKTELPDSLHYIQHRGHLLQSHPDCIGGPMRAVVFWWYFAALARQLYANYLESNIQPKWIAKYPRLDQQKAKRELLAAFNRSKNTTALVVSEGTVIEAVTTLQGDNADAFNQFISLCQREIAKVIVAQTLTLEAQPQGLGGSQSGVQADQLSGIRGFDAALLAETIEEQVGRAWLEMNGMSGGTVPTFTWGADDDDAAVKADMLNDLKLAGIRVKPEGMERLSGIIGLPLELVPEPGEPAPAPPRLSAMSAERPDRHRAAALANERLADRTAADLAEAFGVDFAPLSRAIRESTTAADLEARLTAATAALAPHRAIRVVEECLTAAAANGFACSHG